MKGDYMNFFEVDEHEFDAAMKQAYADIDMQLDGNEDWEELLLVA